MCIKITLPAAPSLGGGLSIEPPAIPAFSGEIGACCKSVPYSTPPVPLPLPSGVFNPGVAIALSNAIDAIQTFLDGALPSCALE